MLLIECGLTGLHEHIMKNSHLLQHTENYTPPDPLLWEGRSDSLPGERFFQHIDWINLQSRMLPDNGQTVFLGFCSDEGVRRNLGRVGAQHGPDDIRKQLAKLACHTPASFIDVGNIVCHGERLEAAQDALSNLVSHIHQTGHKTMAFGGGHEIAWPHFHGLAKHYPKLGIINFDAHFDIRPPINNQGSSGTPFYQIKSFCDEHALPFDYCCLGIQSVANTPGLFQRANDWGIQYLTAEQLQYESLAWQTAFLDEFLMRHQHLYITICLDMFNESFAPGVSAPQALGVNPWRALSLLKYILQSGKVISIDFAELSPPLDVKHKTARLAAILAAELLNETNEGI
jgi:formiminoglutamase